ncbi:MAG: hypothetical protein EOO61_11170 [Hymenobacter sp.]|nr:MAG: hypothetical protein EOO61_11170 [Hymenobacter sp.]
MAIKFKSILLFSLWIVLTGCNPKDPLPTNVWSEGSVQLSPDSEGFRLSGLCCAYAILPKIELNRKQKFSVKSDYYVFTGAGFSSVPTQIEGELSSDGRTLTISYSTGSSVTTHRLQPGAATISSNCGCL